AHAHSIELGDAAHQEPALLLHPPMVQAETVQVSAGCGPGEVAHRDVRLHLHRQPGPVLEHLFRAGPDPRLHLDSPGAVTPGTVTPGAAMLRAQLLQIDGQVEQQALFGVTDLHPECSAELDARLRVPPGLRRLSSACAAPAARATRSRTARASARPTPRRRYCGSTEISTSAGSPGSASAPAAPAGRPSRDAVSSTEWRPGRGFSKRARVVSPLAHHAASRPALKPSLSRAFQARS